MFQVNRRNTRMMSMISLWCLYCYFWTYIMLFKCFNCWLWTGKCQTKYNQWSPNTRKKQYYRTLNLSIHFRVGYRSPVTYNMKLFVTTVNILHPLANFWHKQLHIRSRTGLELNIVKWSAKSKRHWGASTMVECNLGKVWKIHSPRCAKHTFPSRGLFALNEVNIKWSE